MNGVLLPFVGPFNSTEPPHLRVIEQLADLMLDAVKVAGDRRILPLDDW